MNIKTIKNYAVVFSITFALFTAKGQNAGSSNYSLKQAIDYAFKNSPNYLNAELEIQNSKYRKREVLGVGLPQINSSVDLKDYIDIPTSLLPGQFFGAPAGTFIPVKFGTKYNATAGFSASQLIFSSDYIVGVKAAKELINLSTINVNRSKTELVSSVSKAYFNVVVNKERIKLLDANIIKLKKYLMTQKPLTNKVLLSKLI